MPLNVLRPKKAIKKILKDKVDVLESNGEFFFYNGYKYPYPSVMKMKYYVSISKRKHVTEYSKVNIWKRDKGICQYCGKYVSRNEYTVDHVYPRKLGGQNLWTNVVTACFDCNNKKDCKTLDDAGMKLIASPKSPKVFENLEQTIICKIKSLKNGEIPHEWKNYL